MTELDFMFEKNPSLGDKTKVNYRNLYKRVIEMIEGTIHATLNSNLVKIIKKFKVSATAKNALLNVCVKIKQAYGESIEELIKFRNYLFELAAKEKVEQHLVLQETLPSFEEMKAWIDTLYDKGEYKKFVINWLLFNFGVRNMDLDCNVAFDGKRLDKKHNWLNIKVGSVDYVRNKYKTFKTYGQKKNIIKNPKFIDACTKMELAPKQSLLSLTGAEDIPETQLAQIVSRYTMNGLGEGKIFKILVENSTVAGLERLSKNRGTNIATIVSAYNLHQDVESEDSS